MNGDGGGQRLMTARTVTVRFEGSASQATAQIETYCLNQFATPPTLSSSLTLGLLGTPYTGAGDSYDATIEGPSQRIAQCMEDVSAVREDRQLAVWMVSDSLLHHSYEDVKAKLLSQHANSLRLQIEQELRTTIRETIRMQWPNRSDAEIDNDVATYIERTLPGRVQEEAERQANDELAGFVARAKPLIEQCQPAGASMSFFTTAP